MQTIDNATAKQVKAVVAARKEIAARNTHKMMVDGRPATFADLTAAQLNSAVRDANFAMKFTGRNAANEVGADLVQNALAEMVEGTWAWDSTKTTFYSALVARAKLLARAYLSKTSTKREGTGYTAENGEGEETEFSFPTAEISPLAALEANEAEATTLARFSVKERQYLELVKSDLFKAEEIAEIMEFPQYSTFRVWRSKFLAKHNLSETVKAQAVTRKEKSKGKSFMSQKEIAAAQKALEM